jgi:putative spermidine/putrescine transport system substrate-binding protein
MPKTRISRRNLLKAAGAAGLVAQARPVLGASAINAGSTLTVSVWGGITEDSVKKYVEPEFIKLTGAKIAYDIGGVGARYNKLLAQKANPVMDVFFSNDEAIISGYKADVLTPASRKSLPNLAELEPWAMPPKRGTTAETVGAAPFCALAYLLAYNPEEVKKAPTSWADMWLPEFANKLAMASVVHSMMPGFVIMAAEMNGGSEANVDPGFKKLAELRPSKLTVFWTDWAPMLKSGDVTIATEFDYYLEGMKDQKYPIEYVVPKEKALGTIEHVALVKGSKNTEIGEVFLNLMMDAKVQTNFAKGIYQGPINKKVMGLSNAEVARCTCGPRVDQLRFFDAEMTSSVRPAWTERLNTEVLPSWRTR